MCAHNFAYRFVIGCGYGTVCRCSVMVWASSVWVWVWTWLVGLDMDMQDIQQQLSPSIHLVQNT
jgi:hypothetical protein